MDLGSLFLLIALFILVAAFVIRPIIEHHAVEVSEQEQALSTWLARQDRVLDALQELDFDYKLGKIPEADYPAQRTMLLQQGAEILKQLDALQPRRHQPADALEAAIAARRAQTTALAENGGVVPNGMPPSEGHPSDDKIEMLLAERRRERKTKFSGFCSQCGNPLQASDKFCSKCGTKAQ
ncbi:MAG: hypothetical protein Fur0022_29840 [Anaerolineales bacterium]